MRSSFLVSWFVVAAAGTSQLAELAASQAEGALVMRQDTHPDLAADAGPTARSTSFAVVAAVAAAGLFGPWVLALAPRWHRGGSRGTVTADTSNFKTHVELDAQVQEASSPASTAGAARAAKDT